MLRKTIAAMSLFTFVAQTAQALPDPKRGVSFSQWGLSDLDLEGASLLMDADTDTIYVGPKSRQTVEGVYSFLDAPANCQDLKNMRDVTERMPLPEQFQSVLQEVSFYSPKFENSMGVAARNANLLRAIVEAKAETKDYLELHGDLYSAFVEAKTKKVAVEQELTKIQAKLSAADKSFDRAISLIPPDASPEERSEQLRVAQERYREQLTKWSEKEADADERFFEALDDYSAAYGSWAPYEDRLENLTTIETSINTSFATLQRLATESYTRSAALMAKQEGRVIGEASVAYNILGDELEQVRNALAESGSPLSVSRLPIFDVRLNFGVRRDATSRTETAGSGGMTFDYVAQTLRFPAGTLAEGGVSFSQVLGDQDTESASGFQTEGGGDLYLLYGNSAQAFDGSGSVSALVTQGAYCGAPKTEQVTYRGTTEEGEISGTVDKQVYSTPGAPVYSQAVGLSYKYNAQAEPISGACTLDVNRLGDYWRSAGFSKSWSLFGGSRTRSWDNTKTTYEESMGLSCSLTRRPQGANAQESEALIADLEEKLYADMFAMFVTQYAKEYAIETQEVPADPGQVKPLSSIGSGVFTLCGRTSTVCAISGLVLKSADDMLGQRHKGVTSSEDNYTGVIKRSFDIDGYFVAEGYSVINMIVRSANE